MTRSVIFLILFAIILVVGFSGASSDKTSDTNAAEITYVGNEGFLISCGGAKVLVDALYRDGVQGYVAIPAERQKSLEQAKAPFDGVGILLATHHHADHFQPQAVIEHLIANPNALFISTAQSDAELRESGEYERVSDRIKVVVPDEGEAEVIEHSGIKVHVLNLHHGRERPIENLGFAIEIHGTKFLHIGDTEANADDFALNRVLVDNVDFAFVPYWYLAYADMMKAIRQGVTATTFIAMHLPPKALDPSYLDDLGGWDGAITQIRRDFPNAVIFENEMETKTFKIPQQAD